ncbi:hypothetical protein ULMS_01940 [Patiriisocius marinistellae]|uniref:Uncharacterized protein n=1 Tax=Patiriisocius marinistellae TaxID=2494560 RepID=A0A5J4FX35_9FLAO|nr:hypothetical protein [Patiriisocius marinistellae]GEQ84686.1 hypothetical protein ULMS_01940 [Patiriisocius marinistellae]
MLKCKIKGHKLFALTTPHVQIKKFECMNCKKQFTTDGYGKYVSLTPYWEKNHQTFLAYFNEQQQATVV